MDSKRETKARDTRRRHSDEFKQTLVARSLMPGASVAAIAQEAGVKYASGQVTLNSPTCKLQSSPS